MLFFTLAFLGGDILFQQFTNFPNILWLLILIPILIFVIYKNKKLYIIIPILFGFIWSFAFSYERSLSTFPKNLEGKTIFVEGYISSIPESDAIQTQLHFTLQKPMHGTIQLSWRDQKNNLFAGDHWKLAVHLKRIHGMMNPGGSDYEAIAFEEGIIAHGYVINKLNNQIIKHSWINAPIAHLRQSLKNRIDQVLPKTNTSPWIYALALGERNNISQDNWEVLRNTGTNHLMAIAGLHIGFMSGFIFAIINFLWRRSSYLSLKLPAQHAGAIAALLMTITYSALAGFSIPTQRACIMLLVFLTCVLLRRKIISWTAWSIALFLVLLVNPLSILSESFWLSFGSVALIIYGVSGRISQKGLWWKWGRIQWVIALGLIPLSIGLFQQCSLVSLPANTIAIPWVGFIIVSLILLGCLVLSFSAKIGGILLIFADKNLSWMWSVLSYFSHISWAVWYQSIPNHWMIIVAMCGMAILLLPIGFPGRWLGLIGLLPILLFKQMPPAYSEAKLTLLDVGQGLSAVVQTQKHLLVFDTGARFSDNYDMGNSVVVPFVRTLKNKNIDMLVVSHGDNDHSGGVSAILKHIPVLSLKTSVPEKFKQAEYCLQNQSWNWDGVQFEFLYPANNNLHLDNNSSCVLKITAQNKSILLTGDIEKLAERDLILHEKEKLKADILIAPHHGSKTSAENDFLQAVNPEYVLFPVGYRNRYHFPNVKVVEKYKAMQVKQLDTVSDGAIQFVLSSKSLNPGLFRISKKHYWND